MIPRLQEQYNKVIIPNMQKKFALKNKITVPKLTKVVLNMGLGMDGSNKTVLKNCIEDMGLISGQKPLVTKSKKSIAQFKLREGKAIGCKVNLRNNNLYIFLEKLLYTILPQIIETRTNKLKVNKTSMNIGIEDISIFTELENQYDLLKNTQGLTISLDLINKTKNAQIPFYFFSSLKIPIIFKYTK